MSTSNPPLIVDIPSHSMDIDHAFATIAHPPRRRASSLFDRWVQEQQQQSPTIEVDGTMFQSNCNPYLAYPELNRRRKDDDCDVGTLHSYDCLDSLDIPSADAAECNPEQQKPSRSSASRRVLNRISVHNFRSNVPPPRSLSNDSPRTSLFQPRTSSSSTARPRSNTHKRGSSLSTLKTLQAPTLIEPRGGGALSPPSTLRAGSFSSFGGSSSRWRPSVFGTFRMSSTREAGNTSHESSDDTLSIPSSSGHASRPSMSSYYSSTVPSIVTDSGGPSNESSLSFLGSIRSYGAHSWFFSSSNGSGSGSRDGGSTLSLLDVVLDPPPPATQPLHKLSTSTFRPSFVPRAKSQLGLNVTTTSTPTSPEDAEAPQSSSGGSGSKSTPRLPSYGHKTPDPTRPQIAYSLAPPSRLHKLAFPHHLLPKRKDNNKTKSKKKKLVVQGVDPSDIPRFQALKKWCEDFGEVKEIVRMPNGELVVSWSDKGVAERVCKVRAKVVIKDVGGVYLSWVGG